MGIREAIPHRDLPFMHLMGEQEVAGQVPGLGAATGPDYVIRRRPGTVVRPR
jgi:hypothetical protein